MTDRGDRALGREELCPKWLKLLGREVSNINLCASLIEVAYVPVFLLP